MILNKLKKYSNLILTIIAAILLCTFIFSFINRNKSDKRKKISTALLNPKYIETVDKIELKSSDGEIFLQKKNNFWTVTSSDNNYEIPANKKFTLELISSLTNIINLYKVSELSTKNYAIYFPENNSFSLKYYYDDGKSTNLYFGKYDFSQNFRYLMTDKNTSVYEIDTKLDKFLITSFQVWTEQNLISQNILGKIEKNDIQRIVVTDKKTPLKKIIDSSFENFDNIKYQLLELRHGGKLKKTSAIPEEAEMILKLELGNKKDIEINFFPLQDNQNTDTTDPEEIYLVQIKYDLYNSYNYRVSRWTYNKIREMML